VGGLDGPEGEAGENEAPTRAVTTDWPPAG